ncbi:TIGR02452 family protein [Histomonas meleagridis]|uniref:TIGR02452 family protein n=1 Tax=Histomonas meleagridis TaxID=135588 RepID=UPI00355A0ED7|nr:TIGR02452 family protein [Histomonas meleagridis]KAH0797644.1 TIGR02452 family protein [Histomonas meleagridis]
MEDTQEKPKMTKVYKHEIDRPPEVIKNPLAIEALEIFKNGTYTNNLGEVIEIKDALENCMKGTILFKPDHVHNLPTNPHKSPIIEVTREKSLDNCIRITRDHIASGNNSEMRIACLNYASARNPGGGFWSLADEQEETLSRVSGLWPSLITKKEMYEYNRQLDTCLYSDYMILSPDVPVFKDSKYRFLDKPMYFSIITSPAVNAGIVRRRGGPDVDKIEEVMLERIRKVISVAACGKYNVLILGAWGCCCFRNDPVMIANAFKKVLFEEGLGGYFDRICFPIHDYNKGRDLVAIFCDCLGVQRTSIPSDNEPDKKKMTWKDKKEMRKKEKEKEKREALKNEN